MGQTVTLAGVDERPACISLAHPTNPNDGQMYLEEVQATVESLAFI